MSKNIITSQEDQIKSIRRIFSIFETSEGAIRPHFILTGPSGCGKSHLMAMLSEELELPMFEINAAALTKEGTAGNSLSKAMSPLLTMGGSPCICFVDEMDKLFISGNSNSALAHETTNGVQNEFLKVLEGQAAIYGDFGKYINTPTDKVLFVFAGAFNGEENIDLDRLREFGIKTEFLGRVGLTYALQKVTLEEIKNILENSPLLTNYLTLVPDVKKQNVVTDVMEVITANYEKNTIGVRMVNTLIHKFFIEGSLKAKEVKKLVFNKTLSISA